MAFCQSLERKGLKMVDKQEVSGTNLVKAEEVASRLNISKSHAYRLMRSGRNSFA